MATARCELVEAGAQCAWEEIPSLREALRWMERKDRLGQDMFLLGAPGPLRRWLAVHYCRTRSGRPFAYLAITRDTTESDLKQRREITADGSCVFRDQEVVRAALLGHLLILDGLHRAERNVLPVLNNLLENREMALEDGRFLVPATRYARLSQRERRQPATDRQRHATLVPVHPNFRVIALGLPVPPFAGNPIDPPLRSRFQARRISLLRGRALMGLLRSGPHSQAERVRLARLVAFSDHLLRVTEDHADLPGVESRSVAFRHLPTFGTRASLTAAHLLATFTTLSLSAVLDRLLPLAAVQQEMARNLLHRLVDVVRQRDLAASTVPGEYHIRSVTAAALDSRVALVYFAQPSLTVSVRRGTLPLRSPTQLSGEHRVLSELLQSHAIGLCALA
jgi:von Willebrand factor A domain-containing protein 8